MRKTAAIDVRQPRRFQLSAVRVDLKKLFIKLGEAAVHGAQAVAGQGESVGKLLITALGAVEAFSIDTPTEVRAWQLVHRAMTRALGDLTEEIVEAGRIYAGDMERLQVAADIKIDQQDVRLTNDFFSRPQSLRVLRVCVEHFRNWLQTYGLSAADAAAASNRLPSYFVFSLHDEWRLSKETYLPIFDELTSPFTSPAQSEEDWERYRLYLARQLDSPVFGETFSLRQIYVPLRGRFALPTRSEKGGSSSRTARSARHQVVDLHKEVNSWITNTDNDNAICTIRGGPGCGKSTFVRKLASDIANAGSHRVLLFPLQRFIIQDRLTTAMGTYLVNTELFRQSPLDKPGFAASNKRLVLVFDGLDELTKPGELAETEARRFLVELRLTLAQWNLSGCRVVAIVTGRTPVMQATKDAIRVAHRQELDVVRLYVPDTSEHHDPDNLLKEDQREIWWSNYSSCKEGSPSSIPEALLDKDIEELSTEPLLIYLLVLSGFHRDYILGGIDRNLIYQRLFSGVHERKYEDAPVTVRRVLQDQFEEIMELIATAAWYGDGRTASVVEVRSRCPARLERAFNEITAVKGGFHRLIAAFYFQATERSGTSDPAFEFTHKTFGEYLTARSIVRAISEIHDALELRRDFYTERNAAESWFGLCSRQPMDLELGRFLVDELAMPQWKEKLPAWRDALLRVMQFALDEGVPLRAFEGLSSKRAEARARNAEEALLCALTTCSKLTGCIAQIKWPDYHSAGSLIHRLRSQRFVPMRSLALGHLNYLDLNQQYFMNQDLFEANFEGSNLESASFFNADVRGVNFSSCKMTNADLSDTSIDRCNFSGCDLERADFSRTHGFEFMRFYDDQDDYFRVQFRNAKLAGANFVHAELYGADFRDADLRKSDFRGAKLQGARFSGARLEGALFENAKLYGVDISPSEFAISSAELADFTDDGKAEAAFTLQFRSGNSLDRDGGGS